MNTAATALLQALRPYGAIHFQGNCQHCSKIELGGGSMVIDLLHDGMLALNYIDDEVGASFTVVTTSTADAMIEEVIASF